ncbi:MAG: cytochrome c [Pseudomonadota bacterium]
MKTLLTILLTLLAATVIAAGLIHSGGLTNFAADEPHPPMINGVIEYVRERFIAARSEDLELPDLHDPQRIADGGAHYVPMCAGCHLGPGTQDTEIRRGLYPQPPNLAQPTGHKAGHDHSDMAVSAKRQFWIVKHGIKMTGMPAWGATHDDDAIWGLVAFLQKLPEMSPEEFAALSQGTGAGGHGRSGGHDGMKPDDMKGMEGMEGMEGMKGMEKPAGSGPAGHKDAPGAKPHGHGASRKTDDKSEAH